MDDLAERLERTRQEPEYEFELLLLELGDRIAALMDELDISRADLARRLGVSRARVTQLLRGSDNLTLRTLVLVSGALDSQLVLAIEPKQKSASTALKPRAARSA